MKKSITIIGAGGQMGQFFSKYFVGKGFEVTGFDEENKIKDIENTKSELSNDSEIKNFLDEFDGEIEVVTKIKN